MHDLMVGAIAAKMLAENCVIEYRQVVQKAIEDSINHKATAILNEDDMELIRSHVI